MTEDAPLLLSRESLSRLNATINFRDSTLRIHEDLRIKLNRTPSGHLVLPGIRESKNDRSQSNLTDSILGGQIYAASLDVPTTQIAKADLRKIHLHLGHCSEHTLITMMRAAHMSVPVKEIEEIYKECNCQAGIHRITPPNVS